MTQSRSDDAVGNVLLKKFPNRPMAPAVERTEGAYLVLEDGTQLLDANAGGSSFAVLGFSHPVVLDAMRDQMTRFCHVDFNSWTNPLTEELAALILSRAPEGLSRVYFAGGSGSEAVEAAMKLSYQVHHDKGRPERTWFISRNQSYHGATLGGLMVSELNNLGFYEPLLPTNHARIEQHHPLYHRRKNESLDDYARRSAQELENKILEIGVDKVSAFIGETMLSAMVGDVPPAPGYWKYVREVCDRHGVHLILDEVYCGLGRSGRSFCCEWDEVRPDFVTVGKTLSAGYVPLSAVITTDAVATAIADGPQGRIQHGHTHQGHGLGIAAALAVQKVVQTDEMLSRVEELGERMRTSLRDGLGNHPYLRDIRGRGMLFSVEYKCPKKNEFGVRIAEELQANDGILLNAKWHRMSFAPPFILTDDEAERMTDAVVRAFHATADGWTEC